MDELVAGLKSPAWWFSVVMAGIAVNLLSSYLKTWTDKWLEYSFKIQRKRREQRKHTFECELADAKCDPYYAIMLAFRQLRSHLRFVYASLVLLIVTISLAALVFVPNFRVTLSSGVVIVMLAVLAMTSLMRGREAFYNMRLRSEVLDKYMHLIRPQGTFSEYQPPEEAGR